MKHKKSAKSLLIKCKEDFGMTELIKFDKTRAYIGCDQAHTYMICTIKRVKGSSGSHL